MENEPGHGLCDDCRWACVAILGRVLVCPYHERGEPGAERQTRAGAAPPAKIDAEALPVRRRVRNAKTARL